MSNVHFIAMVIEEKLNLARQPSKLFTILFLCHTHTHTTNNKMQMRCQKIQILKMMHHTHDCTPSYNNTLTTIYLIRITPVKVFFFLPSNNTWLLFTVKPNSKHEYNKTQPTTKINELTRKRTENKHKSHVFAK